MWNSHQRRKERERKIQAKERIREQRLLKKIGRDMAVRRAEEESLLR